MDTRAQSRIEGLRSDCSSSATAILLEALALLRDTAAEYPDALGEVADAICAAQPSMAGLRTAAHLVRQSLDPRTDLDRLAHRIRRAPAQISRHARSVLRLRRQGALNAREPIRLATCSASAPVETTIADLAREVPVLACCAESRPALEGRGLAERLSAAAVPVEIYSDAGISAAIPGTEALLVGADAIGSDRFINKVGTAALCARAALTGVAVYVLAGAEKVVPAEVFDSLPLKAGNEGEIWPDQVNPRIRAKNPYFEHIPLSTVTLVISEAGAIPAEEISRATLW